MKSVPVIGKYFDDYVCTGFMEEETMHRQPDTTNCPNCGAAVDLTKNECPYCGTPYFDISYMPIRRPFILKINMGTEENPRIMLMKVKVFAIDEYPEAPQLCVFGEQESISCKERRQFAIKFMEV